MPPKRSPLSDVGTKPLDANEIAEHFGRKMLSADDVGAIFGLTGAWVRKRIRLGDFPIPYRTIGGMRLFSVYDVERYLQGGEDTDEDAAS